MPSFLDQLNQVGHQLKQIGQYPAFGPRRQKPEIAPTDPYQSALSRSITEQNEKDRNEIFPLYNMFKQGMVRPNYPRVIGDYDGGTSGDREDEPPLLLDPAQKDRPIPVGRRSARRDNLPNIPNMPELFTDDPPDDNTTGDPHWDRQLRNMGIEPREFMEWKAGRNRADPTSGDAEDEPPLFLGPPRQPPGIFPGAPYMTGIQPNRSFTIPGIGGPGNNLSQVMMGMT